MAASKKFQTLVELQQKERNIFEVLGNHTRLPKWFHSEYLRCPKAVSLEAWLVEAMFGQDGEHIPHVECVTHTVLHVSRWNPEGEAEILLFGRPYYQQDVSEMIMNLADHFRQLRALSSEKAAAQQSGTRGSPDEVPEARTQKSPDLEVPETGTQTPTKAAQDWVTKL